MKTRIEISCLATQTLSGVSRYTKMLAEALDQQTDLEATYFNFLNKQSKPIINLKNNPIENRIFPLRVYAKLQSHNLALPFDLFKKKVDLTIFPNFATWPCAKSKLRACVVHDLTYIHFPELVEEKNLAHLRRAVPNTIKKADIVITVSNSIKNEIVKEFSISPNKIIVTPIPPDEKFLTPNTTNIFEKYKIPTKKFIFFIGIIEPRKDLPTLVEAYCKLPSSIKNEFSLVIAGSNGWKTEKSEAAIEKAVKSGNQIIRVGFTSDDTPAFYQNASLLVMPSIYEGFGMPVLEAMASNCPVLTSDIPVLIETGGGAAMSAKLGNSDDFAEKIKFILSDQNLINKMRINGKNRVAKISWKNNVDNIINKANQLLDNK